MKPLNIPPGPGIPKGLVIPAAELTERFARSGGPGGQGVNTTDSKVQLSVDIAELSVLSDVYRRRALESQPPTRRHDTHRVRHHAALPSAQPRGSPASLGESHSGSRAATASEAPADSAESGLDCAS